jgi:hypothetical protein
MKHINKVVIKIALIDFMSLNVDLANSFEIKYEDKIHHFSEMYTGISLPKNKLVQADQAVYFPIQNLLKI